MPGSLHIDLSDEFSPGTKPGELFIALRGIITKDNRTSKKFS